MVDHDRIDEEAMKVRIKNKYIVDIDKKFNPTLTKNMPNVKWDQLPPRRGPNPQGVTYGMDKKNKKQQLKNLAKV